MTRTEHEILEEALDSLELVGVYAARSDNSRQLVIDAMCMRIVAGVEALSKLAPERRDELFGDAWTHMRAMRNRITHGYESIDSGIVLATAHTDVPQVLRVIEAELAR